MSWSCLHSFINQICFPPCCNDILSLKSHFSSSSVINQKSVILRGSLPVSVSAATHCLQVANRQSCNFSSHLLLKGSFKAAHIFMNNEETNDCRLLSLVQTIVASRSSYFFVFHSVLWLKYTQISQNIMAIYPKCCWDFVFQQNTSSLQRHGPLKMSCGIWCEDVQSGTMWVGGSIGQICSSTIWTNPVMWS